MDAIDIIAKYLYDKAFLRVSFRDAEYSSYPHAQDSYFKAIRDAEAIISKLREAGYVVYQPTKEQV